MSPTKIATLSLLKLLEDNNFGEIDSNLFWEKIGLDKVGLYIVTIGQSSDKTQRRRVRFELMSRGENDVAGLNKLQAVADFLNGTKVCNLPAVPPYTTDGFTNVDIAPLSTPTDVGQDAHGRVIWSVSGEIKY